MLQLPFRKTGKFFKISFPKPLWKTYDPEELSLEEGKLFLEKQCRWADVIVLGPGLGREPYVCDLVEQILAELLCLLFWMQTD